MITPRFSLSQDEKSLTIKIRAPYCSLRELEVEVDDNTFLFLCKPYYLRLHLPGHIVEDDNARSQFDSDNGEFSFCYQKVNRGEEFKDLEFITKFLATKVDASYGDGEKKITVLASEGSAEEVLTKSESLISGFGFALQSQTNFTSISSEFSDVFEIDPCLVKLPERRKLRLQYEQGKFDMGHYLGDFIEDEEITEILSQKTPWDTLEESKLTFTHKELDFLKDLPNIEYNLSNLQVKYVYNGLIDILYAFCYDRRATFYEENSESGWTIVKLSASLCWLDAFETSKETLICSFRRSIIYPLYRHFDLCLKVLQDLKNLLRLGEHYIIKCLIEIYYIFLGSDCCQYILNNLFIKDYIGYIMKWDKNEWRQFLEEVNKIEIRKEDLGLNLAEIEQGFSLDERMSKLEIKDSDSDDTSVDSDDSASDASESESSDTDSNS